MIFQLFLINQSHNKKRRLCSSFYTFIICIFLFFIHGCGHKQHAVCCVLEAPCNHISRFTFPAPRTITAKRLHESIIVSWTPVLPPQDTVLLGYNVYRITRKHCLPHQPIITTDKYTCSWIDTTNEAATTWYTVQGLFEQNHKIVMGPLSFIAKKIP